MSDQAMTTIVTNLEGRIFVKVWPKGNTKAWDMQFVLSVEDALSLSKELHEAATRGPRVGTWADLGVAA